MRKTEAATKDDKKRWEGETTPAFHMQQKALGMAALPCGEL